MKVRLVVTAALAIALVAGFFVGMAAPAKAQVLPNGPWADRLIWSEQPDSGLGLEQIKIGEGDFFMFSLQGGSQKIDAFTSPGILAFDSFGSINGLAFNPNRQSGDDAPGGNSMNPFTNTTFRAAMQNLIDRNFVVQEILEGFGAEMFTAFTPVDADYFRELETQQDIEVAWPANTVLANQTIADTMMALGATPPWTSASGYWEDSFGDVVEITVIQRIEDERFFIGAYVAEQLEDVGFLVDLQPSPSSVAISMVYAGNPSVGNWHVYTEGWAFTASVAWRDLQLWDFHGCQWEPWCAVANPGVGTHSSPADFVTDSETVAFGAYTSLDQRQSLIRDMLPRTLSETNYRMWLTAEQAVFPVSGRIAGTVFDPLAGPWSEITLKSAKLVAGQPGVDANGVGGDVRVLNFVAFNDGWQPWQDDSWLYDALQRQTIGDPGQFRDPRDGSVIDYRIETAVETAGPWNAPGFTGNLTVPVAAMEWTTGTGFTAVGSGVESVSKVTSTLAEPGKWHTGEDITMDDVIYGVAGMYRRAFEEISLHDNLAATSTLKFYLNNVVKAWEFDTTANTVTTYIDFWHVDDKEIAGAGSQYMGTLEAPVPWQISEALFQSVIDDTTAIKDTTADAKGAERLDLVRNVRSVAAIDTAFAAISAENSGAGRIPMAMSTWITQAEATARYAAAQTFRDDWGHWYASNGPFVLQLLDPTFKQSVMLAFRDGYPFTPDKWDFMQVSGVPDTAFGSFPDSLLAGSAAELSVTTTLGGEPTDPNTVSWFVRQLATGAIPLRGDAIRLGQGEFEVQLLSTLTVGLETGAYDLVVLVQGAQGSTSQEFAFTVTGQIDFFSALFEEVQSGLTATQDQLSDLTEDVQATSSQAAATQNLVLAILALAVIAIVVPAVMLFVILRRMPPGG
jgi:peptide/nickel transport system substrate-binding protein